MRLEFEHSVEGLRVIERGEFRWRTLRSLPGTVFFIAWAAAGHRGSSEQLVLAMLAASFAFDLLWMLGGRLTLFLTSGQLTERRELFGIPLWQASSYPVEELSGPHYSESQDESEKEKFTGLHFYRPGGKVSFGRDLSEEEVSRIISEMETRFPKLRTKWHSAVVHTNDSFKWLKFT